MPNSNEKCWFQTERQNLIGTFAGILIVLGLTLPLIQIVFARVLAQNGWFFETLIGGVWNFLKVSPSAGAWREAMLGWPLLLVLAGVAIAISGRAKHK